MAATGGETNNRVTLRDLFDAITKQNEERYEMERRLTARIEDIAGCIKPLEKAVETHDKEIDRLRNKSDRWDLANTIIAVVGSAIAGILGTRQ